jgi:ubiquitin carboxyl-terminal hydrolase 4/11/15
VTDGQLLNEDSLNFNQNEENTITIDDCFNEFKRQELLDEDNKWYCNKCKEHVQATKQLEIFKVPPILIINLKRFKQSKQSMRYMGMFSGGAGQKIDADVDFPLDGLDMSLYVNGSHEGESLIYDCYAVSNHFGNMGFGHYTAFAKNPLTNKWYEFDDSRVS